MPYPRTRAQILIDELVCELRYHGAIWPIARGRVGYTETAHRMGRIYCQRLANLGLLPVNVEDAIDRMRRLGFAWPMTLQRFTREYKAFAPPLP